MFEDTAVRVAHALKNWGQTAQKLLRNRPYLTRFSVRSEGEGA